MFGRELSLGEKGCFASHYKLWQKCLELNEGIFIIEDDVEFTQAFNANNLKKILKSPYEYVRIYHIKEAKFYDLELNFKITFSNVAGTQGYYLKPSAARKFIKCQFLIKPVDDSMDYSEVLNIVFTPLFLKELPLQSDIATREESNYKLTRELYRIYCNIRRFFFMLKIKRRLKL